MTSYRKIDDALLADLIEQAKESPRKRSHLNLHASFEAPVQRVLIALAEGTYVKPHKHPQGHKWELITAVRGKSVLLVFDDAGVVVERIELSESSPAFGVELEPNTWHTILPLDKEAVILEIKEGPYKPEEGADFADWSPDEGDSETEQFLNWAKKATVSDKYQK